MSEPPAVITPSRRRYEIRGMLAGLYTFGYFTVIFLLFFIDPPDANIDLIKTLLGLLSAIQIAIIQYYFGSSRDIATSNGKKEDKS